MTVRPALAGLLVLAVAATVLAAGLAQLRADSAATACRISGSSVTREIQVGDAKPDDSADDSRSIQQAIDAASRDGGAIVRLPAGVLTLDRPLLLKSNVALKGAGKATVLKASSRFLATEGPHGGHPLITTDGASNVTIAELTADQSGDRLDGNKSGRLNEYLIDVRHSTNALVEGVSTKNPFTYSIAVVASNDFCILNNQTNVSSSGKYNQLDGIHITDSHSGLVAGNRVDQGQGQDGDDGLVAQTIGAPVHDIVYRDNDVRGGSHGSGMQLALGNHEIYNITITNNRFWGSPNGIQTGYYGGSAPVYDVAVSQNHFEDMPGPALDFKGDLSRISVADNTVCRAGRIQVEDGEGNRIGKTVESC